MFRSHFMIPVVALALAVPSVAKADSYVKDPRGFGLQFGERIGDHVSFTITPRKGWSRASEIHCVGFDGTVRHSNFYFPSFEGTYANWMFMPVEGAKCFIKESKP